VDYLAIQLLRFGALFEGLPSRAHLQI
jgi:hypothetical protein